MNRTKTLSLILALVMLFSMAVPVTAFADETSEDVIPVEETPTETEVPAGETEAPATEPVEEPAEETVDEPVVEIVAEDPAGETAVVASADGEPSTASITMGTKPTDGTTTDQPFLSGTGGSTNFRIPALVTLKNGTLVAAADARWNNTADGYGLDTIVSRSNDSGLNWSYTFANYLGDNGNQYNESSTAFIDPSLATDGETIYMLVDLYPTGGFISSIKSGTGFDSDGHLLLSDNSGSSYDYYVGDFTDGTAYIYKTDGTLVSGYTVDAYFNITDTDGTSTNLFFSDSPYQVLCTSYLYLTKSTDGGATWSAPIMLNPKVKKSNEFFYGVGPGGGIVTSTGRIIFPCYTYTTADGNTSVIYSDDGGSTWTRSDDMTVTTSEASISEVTVNGQKYLYMFTRHGGYFVSKDNGATWGNQQSVIDISYNTGCELSTLTYSKLIDGCPAILLSAPASTSDRTNGKIFVGLVQNDLTINWKYTYSVSTGTYQYSDLAELPDGSIGLLYENGSGSITYTNIPIATIATDATIGSTSSEETGKEIPVTLYVGQSTTITDDTGNYVSSYTGSGLDTNIATVAVNGTTVDGGTVTTLGSAVTMNSNSTYTGVIYDGNDNYLVLNGTTLSSTTDITQATVWTVTRSSSYGTTNYTIKSGSYYLTHTSNSLGVSTNADNYTWKYSSGFYYSSGSGWQSTNYYLRTNNGTWQVSTTNGNNGQLYSVETTTTEPVDATTITITGVAIGETSVTVGNTIYNITVKEAPKYVDSNNTPFTCTDYFSDSNNKETVKVTKLTTSVGTSCDLDVNLSGGTWSSGDTTIATVDENGVVTGVSVGETTVTYTSADGFTYTIPVTVVQSYGSANTCKIYVTEITNTQVKYSFNVSTDLLEAQEGELIFVGFDINFAINFFGAEDDGYALTYMASTNSAGNYYALYETDDVTSLNAYTNGALMYQRTAFSETAVQALLRYTINAGYHGTMGWTRTANSDINSSLTFRSQKLPTVTKTIKTVNGVDYTEGMTAKASDMIVYEVTVTQYATTEAITYTNVTLTDKLEGAAFSQSNNSTVSPSLSDSTLEANTTYTYEVTYAITDDDLDVDVTNTVDLSYSYSGQYSEGKYDSSASAVAKISAPTFIPNDIVIDFGLPVTIDYSGEGNHGRYELVSGSATYGSVTVANNVVTYTPNAILQNVDTVTLKNTKGGTYTFEVYPATTVYYEEGFATYTENWTGGSKGTGTQATQVAGESTDEYGYDDAYKGAVDVSNGTQATSSAKGDSAEFTFTGTGVDVYTNSTTETGNLMIQVKNSSGSTVKLISVETALLNGSTSATNFQNVTGYNVPVAAISGLTHGTYTVTIKHTDDKTVNLDGFRVYGTLETEPAFYVTDQEDNPTFIELRDKVLAGLNVNTGNSQYAGDIAKTTLAQVYATVSPTEGAVVLSANNTFDSSTDVQDLLDNGPKNEIYLQPNQALVFTIKTSREVQIGLKALNASTSYTINNGNAQTLSSSTDMFYTVLESGTGNATDGTTITITNNGEGILSITKLKICDDPSAALGELTAEDLIPALLSLGFENESVTPSEPEITYADAALTVKVNDASVVLTKNGVAGETAVFTAAEIRSAAEGLVPEGYVLDEAAFTDVEVTYGETAELSFTVSEEVAEPKPNPERDPKHDPAPGKPVIILRTILNGLKKLFGGFFG